MATLTVEMRLLITCLAAANQYHICFNYNISRLSSTSTVRKLERSLSPPPPHPTFSNCRLNSEQQLSKTQCILCLLQSVWNSLNLQVNIVYSSAGLFRYPEAKLFFVACMSALSIQFQLTLIGISAETWQDLNEILGSSLSGE